MATVNPGVTAADRLSFTVFLAIAIHAAVILGITFTYVQKGPSTHTMEVTLAQHRSKNRPDKADFLAQFDQTGSGTLKKKALTTSPTRADFDDIVIRETAPVEQIAASPDQVEQHSAVVTTSNLEAWKVNTEAVLQPRVEDRKPITGNKTLAQRSLEIASLEARLDQQRQIFARRPRIKRLTSLSTASSADAFYLNSWRRKIERIGNLNYPSEARRNGVYGNLRLMVAILPDGSLKDVQVLESSGQQVLDDAALRIVRLASPFAPFPDELRATTDILEVIRTWQFRKNSSLRSF